MWLMVAIFSTNNIRRPTAEIVHQRSSLTNHLESFLCLLEYFKMLGWGNQWSLTE